ncbi:MAG: prepilin-type N-terminal cleavage/methylation domain-containing protein [Candidatus Omnitrophota bacterium]
MPKIVPFNKKLSEAFTPLHPESRGLQAADEWLCNGTRPLGRGVTGFTLVEIMITVSIIAILTAIAIPSLITMKRAANETAARSNIRILSVAAETLMASRAHYPVTVSEFQEFLNPVSVYCSDLDGAKSEVKGYSYSCVSDASGYAFSAEPLTPGVTGNIVYTASTGSVFTQN